MAASDAEYYFRFRICWYRCLEKVKVYEQTKFCPHISIDGWGLTTSIFEKRTSAILEINFRFRFWPFARNLHIIFCIRTPNFVQIKIPTAEVWRHIHFWRWRPRRLNTTSVSYLLMSLPSDGQSLLADQILSWYLNWRLRYNYFRFRNTNVRHFGILLPVSISTISP